MTPRPTKKAPRHWELAYAARFVAKWEGFLPDAFLDTLASPDVWTIGYGHTGPIHGRAIHAGDHVTHAEAEALLTHDLSHAAHTVAHRVKHPLTFRQRIALISFVFNLGPGVLSGELLSLLNRGNMKAAAKKMKQYNHAGGVVIEGLTRRRNAEAWMMTHSRLPTALRG